jgi:hypothetical protein
VPPEQIIQDIKKPSRDVLKVRVVQTKNSVGFLTLDYTARVVQGIKDFLAYGASMETSTAPFLLKPNTAESEFIRTCKFGHTFKGSFGFTVESRIISSQRPLPGMEALIPLPFGRRVTERVAQGLQLARRAAEEKSSQVVVENFKQGLNANMCESLTKMLDSVESIAIEYKLFWSPTWALSDNLPTTAIRLDRSASPYLQEAASKLKHARQQQKRP